MPLRLERSRCCWRHEQALLSETLLLATNGIGTLVPDMGIAGECVEQVGAPGSFARALNLSAEERSGPLLAAGHTNIVWRLLGKGTAHG